MESVEPRRGSRVVVGIYLAIVTIAGVMGFVLGSAKPEGLDPDLFFVIQLPPTPLGVAIYGMVTVGVGLGAFLLAVAYVSRRTNATSA
jgi:hypothetical protein